MSTRAFVMVALVVGSVLAWSHLAMTAGEAIFNDTVVQRLDLRVNTADWEKLKQNFQENTYYPADLVFNGWNLGGKSGPATVRATTPVLVEAGETMRVQPPFIATTGLPAAATSLTRAARSPSTSRSMPVPSSPSTTAVAHVRCSLTTAPLNGEVSSVTGTRRERSGRSGGQPRRRGGGHGRRRGRWFGRRGSCCFGGGPARRR